VHVDACPDDFVQDPVWLEVHLPELEYTDPLELRGHVTAARTSAKLAAYPLDSGENMTRLVDGVALRDVTVNVDQYFIRARGPSRGHESGERRRSSA